MTGFLLINLFLFKRACQNIVHKPFFFLVSLLIIALVPLLVMNEFFYVRQLPYNLSDELHETLCPARLKNLRPIQIIVTCQQMLKHTMQDQLL